MEPPSALDEDKLRQGHEYLSSLPLYDPSSWGSRWFRLGERMRWYIPRPWWWRRQASSFVLDFLARHFFTWTVPEVVASLFDGARPSILGGDCYQCSSLADGEPIMGGRNYLFGIFIPDHLPVHDSPACACLLTYSTVGIELVRSGLPTSAKQDELD